MKRIAIGNRESGLYAEILPDYGGMMTKLSCGGKDILYFDESMVALSTVLSGGCPVLFPFVSRTRDDRYRTSGKRYSMPFHGLVKDAQFGVAEQGKNSVTLYLTDNEVWRKENFPFAFVLELTYRVEEDRAVFLTTVRNRSDEPMPHAFGWHHWFVARDKERLSIRHGMRKYMDYTDGADGAVADCPAEQDLSKRMDQVFFEKTCNRVEIDNPTDGYAVRMTFDDAYQALVICTCFDGRITAEPWTGVPDTANTGKYLQWVPPHGEKSYRVEMKITAY